MRLPRLYGAQAFTAAKRALHHATPKQASASPLRQWPERSPRGAARLYEETLRLAGRDSAQLPFEPPALPWYLKSKLTRPAEHDTLKAALAVTEGFMAHAPDGLEADYARQTLSQVLTELSPLYRKALGAELQYNKCLALSSILTGVAVGLLGPRESAFDSESAMAMEELCDDAVDLWPRVMMDERAALQAASLGGAPYVDSLSIAARYFPKDWPNCTTPRATHLLEAHRALGANRYLTRVAELTDQEAQNVQTVSDACRHMGRYDIDFYETHFLDPTHIDYHAERRCLHRGYLAHNQDVDIDGLRLFLQSERATQLCQGMARIHAACWRDTERLMLAVTGYSEDQVL